jgi:peptidoglycan/xylan/chitin deacetylase (PgdA/CDA1 family)
VAKPFLGGLGAIFTLHRVRPARDDAFQPNRLLEVTPHFLAATIAKVRARGLDIVDLDEARRRLVTPGRHRRFVVFTLDDGYRDNLDFALPIFRAANAPFTIYVPSAFPSGRGELWWIALEEMVARHARVAPGIAGWPDHLPAGTLDEKWSAWCRLYTHMRAVDEGTQRALVHELCARHGVDMEAICRHAIMDWDEVARIAADPLCTIGAHTVHHHAMAKLTREDAWADMVVGADDLARRLGRRPRHFSFPYGSIDAAGPRDFALAAEMGFSTAVTTRPGVLYPDHAAHLTALPRVSLNGEYQTLRYLDVFLSGLPFYVFNGFERLNVA